MGKMILIIDNYDSFTFNLAHLAATHDDDILVRRNDSLSPDNALALAPRAIILSPGPGEPSQAGICVELVKKAANQKTPLFGVCLGLQAIAFAFGGEIRRADKQMHGKVSQIRHDQTGIFENIPSPFEVRFGSPTGTTF